MKLWLWTLVGLGALLLSGVLIVLLRARAARRAERAVHEMLPQTIELDCPDFEHQGTMPAALSCEGEGGSPPLRWANLPEGTLSLALIVVDPDLPTPNTQWIEFVHWVVYNLPARRSVLGSALSPQALSQLGAVAGRNGYGGREYVAPCPVSGTHSYLYRLYALDVPAIEPESDDKRGVLSAMQGHVLAYGELRGRYACQTLSFWGAMRRNVRRGK
jgi:Raf kinase inhibitor-like YbhB/YbcL family protein